MELLTIGANSTVIQYVLFTLMALLSFFMLRTALVQVVLKHLNLSVEARRRWIVAIRNVLVGIFIIGLVFIWESQLGTFAVSLVAVALALVLATKELIACACGSILRMATNVYGLGDRIEINGIRGKVVDHNLLTTTLLEIGPGQTSQQYTGRAMTIPNSMLFTQNLFNETYSKKYVVHIITIRLTTKDDWRKAETLLLAIARQECAAYIDEAARHLKKLEGNNWLDAPSVEPRVNIQLPEPGRITLFLRVPSPAHRTSRTEQTILRRFLSSFLLEEELNDLAEPTSSTPSQLPPYASHHPELSSPISMHN